MKTTRITWLILLAVALTALFMFKQRSDSQSPRPNQSLSQPETSTSSPVETAVMDEEPAPSLYAVAASVPDSAPSVPPQWIEGAKKAATAPGTDPTPGNPAGK